MYLSLDQKLAKFIPTKSHDRLKNILRRFLNSLDGELQSKNLIDK